MTASTDLARGTGRSASWWLAAFAVAVLVGHHLGTIVGPAGEVAGATEWTDWVDLLTPYAVLGTAAAALLAGAADRTSWGLAALGAVVYTQGHGIHLAANSIGNARGDAAPVHLWDEVMGHYVWYAGLALVVVALARTLHPATTPAALALAVGFGSTTATNAVEGGTPEASLVLAVGLCLAFRYQVLLVVSYAAAAAMIAGWGLYWAVAEQRWFPQFSELGWI